MPRARVRRRLSDVLPDASEGEGKGEQERRKDEQAVRGTEEHPGEAEERVVLKELRPAGHPVSTGPMTGQHEVVGEDQSGGYGRRRHEPRRPPPRPEEPRNSQGRGQEGIGRTIARNEPQHQTGRDHPGGGGRPGHEQQRGHDQELGQAVLPEGLAADHPGRRAKRVDQRQHERETRRRASPQQQEEQRGGSRRQQRGGELLHDPGHALERLLRPSAVLEVQGRGNVERAGQDGKHDGIERDGARRRGPTESSRSGQGCAHAAPATGWDRARGSRAGGSRRADTARGRCLRR